MNTITISKKEYNLLKRHSKEYLKVAKKTVGAQGNKFDGSEEITEEFILQMAKEARRLNRAGKLPLFKDLIRKEYPQLAKKYSLK